MAPTHVETVHQEQPRLATVVLWALVYDSFIDFFRRVSSDEPKLSLLFYDYITVVNEWDSPR